MAIQATLYSVSKDRNSTALPSGEGWTMDIRLKDGCSIIAPGVIFDFGLQGNPQVYNYLYIPDFRRYYWINDWTYDRGLWIAACTVDALASWRDDIGASSQYIARAAAAFDGAVSDSAYPMTANTSTVQRTAANPFAQQLAGGMYVVGIVNNDNAGVGSIGYYVFNQAGFNTFKNVLFSNMDWAGFIFDDITNLNETLLKAQFNPFQYVVSCVWLPFFVSGLSNPIKDLPYGWWTLSIHTGLCGRLSNTPTHQINITVDIPKHPQQVRGVFLNYEPFSHYSLQLPFLGCRSLAGRFVADAPSITTSYVVDCVTGQANIDIGGFLRDTVQIGTPIQLAQMAVDYLGAVESASNTAAGIVGSVLSGDAAGLIQSAVTGITSIVDASIPNLSSKGNNGSIAGAYITPRLVATFASVADDDPERLGRPLCQLRQISTLPGYVQTVNAHMGIPATASEIKSIEAAMNSGFFWE